MHFFRGFISWKYNFKPHQARRIKVAPKGLPPLLGALWPRYLLSPYPSIHKIMSVLSFYFMLSEVGLHPAVNVCARFCATLARFFFCPELFLQDWKATKVQATRKCLHQFVVCFIFCLFVSFFFSPPAGQIWKEWANPFALAFRSCVQDIVLWCCCCLCSAGWKSFPNVCFFTTWRCKPGNRWNVCLSVCASHRK